MRQRLQEFFIEGNAKKMLLNTAFMLFLFSLIYRFTKQIFITFGYESWVLSEFLINYQGGFVRRGLGGEILLLLIKNFNINLEWTIKIFSLFCFVGVCIFFIRAFLKKGYTLYILPLCFFLGMGALTCFWIKKDYLMVCFLISILWVFRCKLSMIIKIPALNILIIFMQLIHETFAFFTLPILFLLFFYEYKNKGVFRSLALSLLSILPSVFCFLLTLYFRGDMITAQSIWDSWVAAANLNQSTVDEESHGALSAIGWSTEWTFNTHFNKNFLTKNRDIFPIVYWSFAFPIVYYILSNTLLAFRKSEDSFTNKDKTILSTVLLFQLLCLTPFFLVLSCDLVRISFYWTTSSFAIFLLVPKRTLENIFPTFFIRLTLGINRIFTAIIRPTKTTITLLIMFIGIPYVGFSFDEAVDSTVIYNILWTISYGLLISKKIILMLF